MCGPAKESIARGQTGVVGVPVWLPPGFWLHWNVPCDAGERICSKEGKIAWNARVTAAQVAGWSGAYYEQ